MDDLIRRSDAVKAMAKAVGRILYDADAISYHTMQAIPAVDAVPKEFHDKTCMALFERHVEEMLAVEPKQGEWIPCSERLPFAEYGESDTVLVTCESTLIRLLYFNGGNWCYPTGECYEHRIDKVVAWMPLPEPWEGADDE